MPEREAINDSLSQLRIYGSGGREVLHDVRFPAPGAACGHSGTRVVEISVRHHFVVGRGIALARKRDAGLGIGAIC